MYEETLSAIEKLNIDDNVKQQVRQLVEDALSLKEKKENERSFKARKIYEWIEPFINSSVPLIMSPIYLWIEWGADLEMDIKPVAEKWKKRYPEKNMYTLAWLNEDIQKSIAWRKDVDAVKESLNLLGGRK